ncbi:MAG: urease accessory protein UreD [Gammaproteobacteria bacterium]|nr:urease accessory protein UreD [Gammaproteobacteria bacterium]
MHNDLSNSWVAKLELQFSKSKAKTFLSKRKHIGPLVIQRPFYPEGDLCHLYLLHPPGGVVGGDHLTIDVKTEEGSCSLITTPGATKIYRSKDHKCSVINQNFNIENDSSLEWLPMETIIFPGAESKFFTKFSLFGNAKVAAWEVQCLGRPVINEFFDAGNLKFSFELWRDGIPILLDKLKIDQSELDNVVGLRGYPVFGTFVISNASQIVLDLVRRKIPQDEDCIYGVTQIEGIIVIRCLSSKTHLVQDFFRNIWKLVRPLVFDREASIPRIWAT